MTPTGCEHPANPSLNSANPETGAAESDANRADFAPETPSLDDLADVLLALPKAERLRLAKLLLGRDQTKGTPRKAGKGKVQS